MRAETVSVSLRVHLSYRTLSFCPEWVLAANALPASTNAPARYRRPVDQDSAGVAQFPFVFDDRVDDRVPPCVANRHVMADAPFLDHPRGEHDQLSTGVLGGAGTPDAVQAQFGESKSQ